MGRYLDIARATTAKRQAKPEVSTATPSRSAVIRRQTSQAGNWRDLSQIVERIEADFGSGEITRTEAEELATEIAQKARSLPEQDADTGATEEQHLSDMFNEKPIRRVRSKVLGEEVLWAADNAEIPTDNDLVVYRESELREIVGREPAALRAIHKAKRDLDGEIVGNAASYE